MKLAEKREKRANKNLLRSDRGHLGVTTCLRPRRMCTLAGVGVCAAEVFGEELGGGGAWTHIYKCQKAFMTLSTAPVQEGWDEGPLV